MTLPVGTHVPNDETSDPPSPSAVFNFFQPGLLLSEGREILLSGTGRFSTLVTPD